MADEANINGPLGSVRRTTMPTSRAEQVEPGFPLLSLPLEVRLHIYHWLHLMGPVHFRELAPWYPTPRHSTYITLPVCMETAAAETHQAAGGHGESQGGENGVNNENQDNRQAAAPVFEDVVTKVRQCQEEMGLLSPFRPYAALPTALLQANKQIYLEARHIPMQNNEFPFLNWFATGLSAASYVTERLQPWQLAQLRYVRLEMMYQDTELFPLQKWEDLCLAWASGLRGLRITLATRWATATRDMRPLIGIDETTGRPGRPVWNMVLLQYLGEGLSQLSALEKVEVEMMGDHMHDLEKIAWCRELQRFLTALGRSRAEVLCTKLVYKYDNKGPERRRKAMPNIWVKES